MRRRHVAFGEDLPTEETTSVEPEPQGPCTASWQDPSTCPPELTSECTCPDGTVPDALHGQCVDPRYACNPGYQWYDQTQECLPIPVTGPEAALTPGAVPYTQPAKKVVRGGGAAIPSVAPTPSLVTRWASVLGGKNALWIAGGVAVAVGLLVLVSKTRSTQMSANTRGRRSGGGGGNRWYRYALYCPLCGKHRGWTNEARSRPSWTTCPEHATEPVHARRPWPEEPR
jgi:hypothetical protein